METTYSSITTDLNFRKIPVLAITWIVKIKKKIKFDYLLL